VRGNGTKNKLRDLASAADLIVKSFDFLCQTCGQVGNVLICLRVFYLWDSKALLQCLRSLLTEKDCV
jgi:hypothetical protein